MWPFITENNHISWIIRWRIAGVFSKGHSEYMCRMDLRRWDGKHRKSGWMANLAVHERRWRLGLEGSSRGGKKGTDSEYSLGNTRTYCWSQVDGYGRKEEDMALKILAGPLCCVRWAREGQGRGRLWAGMKSSTSACAMWDAHELLQQRCLELRAQFAALAPTFGEEFKGQIV